MAFAAGHDPSPIAPGVRGPIGVQVTDLVVDGLPPLTFTLERGHVAFVVSTPACDARQVMSAVAGMRAADSGAVTIAGTPLRPLEDAVVRRSRFELVGYVRGDIALDLERTVAQNIAAPIRLAGREVDDAAKAWLERLAQSFGVMGVLDRPAGELDRGLQQRVAIARALATQPPFVYAEDPTAVLDERGARVVMALLRTIAHEFGIALAISTQTPSLAASGERVIVLRDGRIVGDGRADDARWVHTLLDGAHPEAASSSPPIAPAP